MFGWLNIRRSKPTTAGISDGKCNGSNGRLPKLTAGVGGNGASTASDTLKPHPLLSVLPEGTLERLLTDPGVKEYPKGTVIFREGGPCDALFLIISGRCEARRKELNGHYRVEEVLGPGDTLGERALLNREPHRHTAVVATHAVLLRIPSEELQGLFAKDPCLAGRFSQAVVERPAARGRRLSGGNAPVRRVVTILPLSLRVDADAVVRQLASSLFKLTGQRVLTVRLGPAREGLAVTDWRVQEATLSAEFRLAGDLHSHEEGCDELRVTTESKPGERAAMASLISHCAQHYDYVLLQIHPETPVPSTIESVVESDLTYVLLQPSARNLYDFKLFLKELNNRSTAAAGTVKPIICAEETIATPEFHAALKELGIPAHSIVRGFPVRVDPSWPDHRFSLHINRLAREIARCRIGLALSSGGAKGLAHIGVIQVLEENGIEIDCIAGSSMGAYVGAIWAYGLDGTMLEKTARELEGRWGLLRLIDPMVPPRRGFVRTRRTVARLRKSIGGVHFSELIRPLRVIATHLDTLERVVFSSGEVAGAVEASIAIPGVCVPVTMDGETYIDGGIADPLPVDVLAETGIERIIAVNVIPPPERIRFWLDAEREKNGREARHAGFGRFFSDHFNYLAHGNILDTMMQAINGAQTRIAESSAREADVVLRPLAGDATWHDFTNPGKYIALGRSVAEAQIAELKALAHGTPYEPEKPLALRSTLAA